jgi:hypothetical protein
MQKNRKIAGDKLVGGNSSSRWATGSKFTY